MFPFWSINIAVTLGTFSSSASFAPFLFLSIQTVPVIFFVYDGLSGSTLFLSNSSTTCVMLLLSISPILLCVIFPLFVIVVSLVKDFAITSTFTFAVVNSPRLKFTSISPFSFTLTSVLFVPSEYIVSTLLSCTSSGSLSVNITSSIGIAERFDIVNVYVYFSAAEIVVFAGILHVCTMLTPILLIVSVNVGIVSAFFPSASMVPVIETSFL